MSRGSWLAFFFVMLGGSGNIYAQTKGRPAAATRQRVIAFSWYEVGANYMMWNEDIGISSGSSSADGFANYAGLGVNVQRNWLRDRSIWGLSFSYAFGKASSGGFNGNLTYADGINRAWSAFQLAGNYLYRSNTTFSAGPGILVRQRTADWTAEDSSLSISPAAGFQYAPQIWLRWQINREISFSQVFSALNFKSSYMWTWGAEYRL
jgi:hypothetical protein